MTTRKRGSGVVLLPGGGGWFHEELASHDGTLRRCDSATLRAGDRRAYVYFMGVGDEGVGEGAKLMLWLGSWDLDDPEWDPADHLHELGVVRLTDEDNLVFEPA